jgi:hypothetical protein
MRQILFWTLSALLCLSLGAGRLAAQVTSGTILGSVQDTTGAAIPGATVTATATAVGITRTVTSTGNGTFSLPNLDAATYTVSVTAKGFETRTKTGVVLSSADKLNAGVFTLKVGAEATTVTVEADSGQLQLQANSGERSDLITGKQLNDIALNGRNVLDLLRTIPGVAGFSAFGTSGTGGLTAYSINGTRTNEHQFTIDGASNVDTGDNGGTQVTINTDAIAEVKVLTSNYQAEFGKAGGGSIIVTSRGGTNQIHGNVHFFHRNEGLDANNWLSDKNHIAKQKYRLNTIGAQIGGPIIKDRLFFFYSNEFFRQLQPGSISTYRVPTNLERMGDFSQSKDSSGNAIQIYNPNTGTQFINNMITPGQLTAAQQANFTQIQAILNLYPQPNVTNANTYNRQDPLSFDHPRAEYIGRVDYQISPGERLFVRYINNRDTQTGPVGSFGGLFCAGSLQIPGGCTDKQPGWNLSVDLTSTLRPNLVNEVNIGPSVYRSDIAGVNGNLTVGKNNINLPLLYPVTSTTSIPDFGFSGNGQSYPSTYLGATPWHQANTTLDANDNLTWQLRSHTLKFGAYYQRARKDQIAYGNSNGSFSFSANCTGPAGCATGTSSFNGSPFASALVGQFSGFNQSSARPTGYFRYNQLEFYAQDTWQLSPRLTLDYGMRFAYIPPQYDAKNQVALFVPGSFVPGNAVQINPTSGNIVTPVTGTLLDGEAYASNGGIPKGGWNGTGILYEPRVGFAWDFVGDHKSVLRGGFGSSHDREQGNLIFNTVFSNPAVVVSPSFTNQNLSSISSAQANAPGVLGNIVGADRSGQVPVVWSYSLGIQREVGAGVTLDIAYVGTQGRHLVTDRNINSIPYGTAFQKAAQNPASFPGGVVPNVEPNLPREYAAAGYNFSGRYAYQQNYLAPYHGYGQMDYYKFDGTSNYNSLQVSVQRRFTRKLTFGGAYTWAKNLTTSGSDQSYVDPFNPRKYSYGEPSYERRNVASINYVYDLPKFSRVLHAPDFVSYITDGFQLSGFADMQGGQPVRNAQYVPANQLTGGSQYSKTPPYYTGVDQQGNLLLPTIGAPDLGAPGSLRQGGFVTWDSSIFKNFALGAEGKGRYIQLRGEFFTSSTTPTSARGTMAQTSRYPRITAPTTPTRHSPSPRAAPLARPQVLSAPTAPAARASSSSRPRCTSRPSNPSGPSACFLSRRQARSYLLC